MVYIIYLAAVTIVLVANVHRRAKHTYLDIRLSEDDTDAAQFGYNNGNHYWPLVVSYKQPLICKVTGS